MLSTSATASRTAARGTSATVVASASPIERAGIIASVIASVGVSVIIIVVVIISVYVIIIIPVAVATVATVYRIVLRGTLCIDVRAIYSISGTGIAVVGSEAAANRISTAIATIYILPCAVVVYNAAVAGTDMASGTGN